MNFISSLLQEFRIEIDELRAKNKNIFATSSFQTNSIVLLHMISQVDKDIPIYMLNTGFLFAETLTFKAVLKEELDLKIIELKSSVNKVNQRTADGKLMYIGDPDYCCYLNKIKPLESIIENNDIWISGIRKSQNDNRSKLNKFELTPNGCMRYHPIIEMSNKEVYQYINYFNLPKHPLENDGYASIGCQPCTAKISLNDGEERMGRWNGMKKTECGLHIDLIAKNK